MHIRQIVYAYKVNRICILGRIVYAYKVVSYMHIRQIVYAYRFRTFPTLHSE